MSNGQGKKVYADGAVRVGVWENNRFTQNGQHCVIVQPCEYMYRGQMSVGPMT